MIPPQLPPGQSNAWSATKLTDVRIKGAELYFLPVHTRVTLKFGTETLTSVICARVRVMVEDGHGRRAEGWGETPLSVQWVWPSEASYSLRNAALQDFCCQLAKAWAQFDGSGHAIEIGYDFQQTVLPELLARFDHGKPPTERMPLLAALVCCSPFDLALHDAYGMVHDASVYNTYNRQYMNRDLSRFLSPADDAEVSFEGKYPADYLTLPRVERMPVWHLVGGLDPLRLARPKPARSFRCAGPKPTACW